MNDKLKEKLVRIITAQEKLARAIVRFNKLADGEIVLAEDSAMMVESGIDKMAELLDVELGKNDITLSDAFTIGDIYVFQVEDPFALNLEGAGFDD